MRKHFVWVLGLALAIGITAVATASNTQKLQVSFSPSKAPAKGKGVGGTLHTITTAGSTTTGPGAIKPATKVQVYFDDDFTFNAKGIGTCTLAKLANTTTAAAKAACGNAIVGSGKATTGLAGNPDPAAEIPGVITAFNGPKQGGKLTILLHTYVTALGAPVVLTGVLNVTGGDLGNRLDVVVPPLAAGAALKLFDVKVFKKTGKNNYVTATCSDKDKTWNFKGKFTFSGGEPSKTVTSKTKCSVKN